MHQRIAWVTGGASGIGAAVVAAFAARGDTVVTLDLTVPESAAPAALALPCNVSDAASVAEAVTRLQRDGLQADVLVTSAGWSRTATVQTLALEDLQRMLDVNLTGSLLLMQAALPRMIDRGWGRVVCIASGQAVRPTAGQGGYAASKAALVALAKAAAVEVAATGVTVNVIAPGMVDTPMTRTLWGGAEQVREAAEVSAIANPMRRVIEPSDIAAAASYLCSDQARFLTGQVLHVNAGSLMP